jgi:protein O-GlcNAc transferase
MDPEKLCLTARLAHERGQHDEAEALYRKTLKKRPRHADALQYLALLLHQRGQNAEAHELVVKSLAVRPGSAIAEQILGLTLAALGDLKAAETAYRRSIALNPSDPNIYANLGEVFLQTGRHREAIEILDKALALNPNFDIVLFNLAVCHQALGRSDLALPLFDRVLALRPVFAEAHRGRALALKELGRVEEAIVACKKAVAHRPGYLDALNDLGKALYEADRIDEATVVFRTIVSQTPNYILGWTNLVLLLDKQFRHAEAIEAGLAGLAANPESTLLLLRVLNAQRAACDWRDYEKGVAALRARLTQAEPFHAIAIPTTPAEQLACAKAWSSGIACDAPFVHAPRDTKGPIRIGYLSCDFHTHATAYLMAELFERHDRSRFHIAAYAYDKDDGSPIRRRLVNAFDRFVEVDNEPTRAIQQRIYEDGTDILVDLKGFTGSARPEIPARRPAPVQVNYVGFPGTLGADYIDYIIADRFVAPFEHQPFFSEKIVQLPHSYQPNDSKRQISDEVLSRGDFGLPENAFVFSNFNGSYKITPQIFSVWMRLLAAVPGSILWLLASNDTAQNNLSREAAAHGIDPARLVFTPGLVLERHLARLRLADLFLDTIPVGAHTTASDALWAGLPVLTVTGESFAARVGTSLVHAVGLPEMAAPSLDAYEARALELARNRSELAAIREKLTANRLTAPLFDIARYTRALERAYEQMWDRWQRGLPPEPFAVSDE